MSDLRSWTPTRRMKRSQKLAFALEPGRVSVSKAAGPLAASIMSRVVWVWAVLVIVIYRPANLARREKQVADRPEAESARRPAVAGAAGLIGR